jgi:hypothetical protein
VRHVAIPALLYALDPALELARARASLVRRAGATAREAREAGRAVESWGTRLLFRHCRIQADDVAIDAAALGSYPAVMQEAVMRKVWQSLEPANALTRRDLQACRRLLSAGGGGSRVELPRGWLAERDLEVVRVRRNIRPFSVFGPLRLRVPGHVSWNGRRIEGEWTSADRALHLAGKQRDVEYFAADGVEGELEVRAARADERFIPFGRRHPIPIGEFLSKQRVSRELRFRRVVLADHGGILWVIGVRRSARAPVTAATQRAIRVHAESHD